VRYRCPIGASVKKTTLVNSRCEKNLNRYIAVELFFLSELPIFRGSAEIRGFRELLGHFWDRCKFEEKIFEGVWTEFLMTKTINSFVIFYTVPKNRHASAFIVTLAAYGTSVSAFLIGHVESFPAFYFRITNQITVYIVVLSVVKMRQNVGY
jgi:hypothetical protein